MLPKLRRQNWIEFDNLSSDNSLNEVLNDYKIDYSDSCYNKETSPVMNKALKDFLQSPRRDVMSFSSRLKQNFNEKVTMDSKSFENKYSHKRNIK